jgi:hypothetical protein
VLPDLHEDEEDAYGYQRQDLAYLMVRAHLHLAGHFSFCVGDEDLVNRVIQEGLVPPLWTMKTHS